MLGQRGGCIIVDSTKKGKRFPDSMSKTIPIWTCVLNRAIVNYRNKTSLADATLETEASKITYMLTPSGNLSIHVSCLYLSSIYLIGKPLRPLWVSPKTVIGLNEVPEYDSWEFTPIILVSASTSDGHYQQLTTSEFSWNYIPGAGDDEESWSTGLTPSLFWNHVYEIINLGPDMCNQKVADIVEKDRVYRAQRGHFAPQKSLKSLKLPVDNGHFSVNESELNWEICGIDAESSRINNNNDHIICWLGSTNLAVGATQHGIVYLGPVSFA